MHFENQILSTSTVSQETIDSDRRIVVEGRSGCHLRLVHEGGRTLLRKYSKSVDYSARLVKQANKQTCFYRFVTDCDFRVPNVSSVFAGDAQRPAHVDMEFVHAEKYSDFLGKVSSVRLARFTQSILNYLEQLVQHSRQIRLRKEILIRKLESVTAAIEKKQNDRRLVADAFEYLKTPPNDVILLGRCHGDFTLSNMLFHCDRVYLIDFLDAFIETPVQDVVKLRQDTSFHWSLMLEPMLPAHQRDRVLQTLQYIDGRVRLWMMQHESIFIWYDYLQVFNLYRILPYVSVEHEINFVQQALKRQLNHAANHSDGRALNTISWSQTQVDADTSERTVHGDPGNIGPEPIGL